MSTLEIVPSMVLPLAILSSARATSARQRTAATENATTFLMKVLPFASPAEHEIVPRRKPDSPETDWRLEMQPSHSRQVASASRGSWRGRLGSCGLHQKDFERQPPLRL